MIVKLIVIVRSVLTMTNKPIHKEPTNREHCCSCCPELEKEVRFLKMLLRNTKGKLASAKIKISKL